MRCWMSTGAGIRVPMPARLRVVAVWQDAHLPAPLKYASPAARLPTRMSPTVKTADPRIVSFTRCRRECASPTISWSVKVTLALPLCVACPAFRNGPRTLPGVGDERSKLGSGRVGHAALPPNDL